MTLLDTLFDNAFFQLPLLEGMMYVAIVMLIGAGIIGLGNRLVGSRPRDADSYELKKAA